MTHRRAFTLLELLLVIMIMAVLAAVVVPALSYSRQQSHGLLCLSRMREVARGWQMYSDDNDDIILPARAPALAGGSANPSNWYDVGNGLKYLPRWPAMLGRYIGEYAFDLPSTANERQAYSGIVYQCPTAPDRIDERNYAFGYNYQFLGNTHKLKSAYYRFPVNRSRLAGTGGTVMIADSLGTAAGFPIEARKDYSRATTDYDAIGNAAWTLDPPRMTAACDRGTGDPGSPRSGIDPRHAGKVNVLFCDGHGEYLIPEAIGYRASPDGSLLEDALGPFRPSNTVFSGTGRDDDPPAEPFSE